MTAEQVVAFLEEERDKSWEARAKKVDLALARGKQADTTYQSAQIDLLEWLIVTINFLINAEAEQQPVDAAKAAADDNADADQVAKFSTDLQAVLDDRTHWDVRRLLLADMILRYGKLPILEQIDQAQRNEIPSNPRNSSKV